jgi:putative transposase
MRCRFAMCVYGYVVMPEHVHLLLNEPEQGMLADAIHLLKLSFAKRVPWLGDSHSGVFWQKRYHDRNVRDEREFAKKLRYLHRNPVKRGLVKQPGEWKWSSFRKYALREVGVVEIESEWTARDRETAAQVRRCFCSQISSPQVSLPQVSSSQVSSHNPLANLGHLPQRTRNLEWATRHV